MQDVALQSLGAQRDFALSLWERRPVRVHAIDRATGHESDGLVLGQLALCCHVPAVSQHGDPIG